MELGHDDLVEALELGAVREVGLLFFFFLGLLLGFRRFLVGFLVGPTRWRRWESAWDVSTLEDAATRFAMVNHSAREPARPFVQNIESSARRVTEM